MWRLDTRSTIGSGGVNGSSASGSSGLKGSTSAMSAGSHKLSIVGSTLVQSLSRDEGPIVAVHHYMDDCCSAIIYATSLGGIYGWDLRARREIFHLPTRPELGYITALTVSPENTWLCFGTAYGIVGFYNMKHLTLCKLYQLSNSSQPINRLMCCRSKSKSPAVSGSSPSNGIPSSNLNLNQMTSHQSNGSKQSYLFISSGKAEVSVFEFPAALLSTTSSSECLTCLRCLNISQSVNKSSSLDTLPSLIEIQIPAHPSALITRVLSNNRYSNHFNLDTDGAATNYNANLSLNVLAILGKVSRTTNRPVSVITGDSEGVIRYWDLESPTKSYAICGLAAGQPRPTFEVPIARENSTPATPVPPAVPGVNGVGTNGGSKPGGFLGSGGLGNGRRYGSSPSGLSDGGARGINGVKGGKLMICYDSDIPSAQALLQTHIPLREGRGPVPPVNGFKVRMPGICLYLRKNCGPIRI